MVRWDRWRKCIESDGERAQTTLGGCVEAHSNQARKRCKCRHVIFTPPRWNCTRVQIQLLDLQQVLRIPWLNSDTVCVDERLDYTSRCKWFCRYWSVCVRGRMKIEKSKRRPTVFAAKREGPLFAILRLPESGISWFLPRQYHKHFHFLVHVCLASFYFKPKTLIPFDNTYYILYICLRGVIEVQMMTKHFSKCGFCFSKATHVCAFTCT